MSYFGDGTFKQEIMDEVKTAMACHGKGNLDAIEALGEIIAVLTMSVPKEIRGQSQEQYEAAMTVFRAWEKGEVSSASMRKLGASLGLEAA